MSAGKLGRYITSKAFAARVGDVVEEAVADLEARGFKPAYDKPESVKSRSESEAAVTVTAKVPRAKRRKLSAA